MTARKSLNLEKSLAGLESLVEELEGGELPLDKAMKKFEEGVKLTRECQAALKKIMGKALDNADEDPMDQLRGHSMHIIACLEDPAVIRKILNHLQEKSPRDAGIRTPILARRHKLACSANLAESSCFIHVAIRNGFDTTAGMQEVEQRRSSCRGCRLV